MVSHLQRVFHDRDNKHNFWCLKWPRGNGPLNIHACMLTSFHYIIIIMEIVISGSAVFMLNRGLQVLFEELKLDQRLLTKAKIAKTSSGKQKSTSESVLQQLSETHPLPDIILEHRQVGKQPIYMYFTIWVLKLITQTFTYVQIPLYKDVLIWMHYEIRCDIFKGHPPSPHLLKCFMTNTLYRSAHKVML